MFKRSEFGSNILYQEKFVIGQCLLVYGINNTGEVFIWKITNCGNDCTNNNCKKSYLYLYFKFCHFTQQLSTVSLTVFIWVCFTGYPNKLPGVGRRCDICCWFPCFFHLPWNYKFIVCQWILENPAVVCWINRKVFIAFFIF